MFQGGKYQFQKRFKKNVFVQSHCRNKATSWYQLLVHKPVQTCGQYKSKLYRHAQIKHIFLNLSPTKKKKNVLKSNKLPILRGSDLPVVFSVLRVKIWWHADLYDLSCLSSFVCTK